MSRYAATIDTAMSPEEFTRSFDGMRSWRFDRNGWITKASYSESGRVVLVECETRDKEKFLQWLTARNWEPRELVELDLIQEAGTVWSMHRPQVN